MNTRAATLFEGIANNAILIAHGVTEIDQLPDDDLQIGVLLALLQDDAKNQSSYLTWGENKPQPEVASTLRNDFLVTEERADKLSGAWGKHPLLGRMYLPAYRAGTERVAESAPHLSRSARASRNLRLQWTSRHPDRRSGSQELITRESNISRSKQLRRFLFQRQNQLAEQRIRPGKPCAGKFIWIILVEAFMHEARTRIALLQPAKALPLFLSSSVVSARMMMAIGQIMSGPTCGPPIPSAAVPRKKYGLDSLSTNFRVARYIGSDLRAGSKVRHPEKARNIGVVHKDCVAKAIYFIRPYLAGIGMMTRRILLQRGFYLLSQLRRLARCR